MDLAWDYPVSRSRANVIINIGTSGFPSGFPPGFPSGWFPPGFPCPQDGMPIRDTSRFGSRFRCLLVLLWAQHRGSPSAWLHV